jgi:hypothetical protein
MSYWMTGWSLARPWNWFYRSSLYDFLRRRFFGTLAPLLRASDSPIAIACFLLLTFLPDRPLFSVPDFRFFMARPTFLAAPFEYFRFLAFLAIACSSK